MPLHRIVAHQGNWDEILMFALPILIAIGAVRWAERRSRIRRDERATATSVSEPRQGSHDDPAD